MSILTSRRAMAAATAATALLALLPATGAAKLVSFGSSLKARASVKKAHQADTAFWQTKAPAGRSQRAPVSGQIKAVKVKGIALSSWKPGSPIGGERMFHLQTLRKQANGRWKILVTTQPFFLPGRGTPSQTISTYRPINFCVAKGDAVVFNTVGGWDGIASGTGPYPNGTPLQIFSRTAGATVAEYEKAGGTNNGNVITAKTGPGAGHELLMRMTVGTGPNGTALCKGGTDVTP
jgi:ketosteroid isomerase-like protein